jgi:hypothetical protein
MEMNSSSGRERMPDMLSNVDCVMKVAISGCKVGPNFVEGIKGAFNVALAVPPGYYCSTNSAFSNSKKSGSVSIYYRKWGIGIRHKLYYLGATIFHGNSLARGNPDLSLTPIQNGPSMKQKAMSMLVVSGNSNRPKLHTLRR